MLMGKIYAMSDIHGYFEIMEENLKKIELDDKENQLIFCGDYIDYGPESCKVLYRIKDLMDMYPNQIIALKGNHETMFLEFLEADDEDVWNIEWIGGDKQLSTLRTFISQDIQEIIKNLERGINNPIKLAYELARISKEDIKENHRDLIIWLKDLPLYYERENQIFVHAGIDEEAEELWKYITLEEIFVSKYPASFGKFYKDIIAGHVGTYSLKNEKGFHDIYWDGESHYYIDGTVEVSARIPLLIYDKKTGEYIY